MRKQDRFVIKPKFPSEYYYYYCRYRRRRVAAVVDTRNTESARTTHYVHEKPPAECWTCGRALHAYVVGLRRSRFFPRLPLPPPRRVIANRTVSPSTGRQSYRTTMKKILVAEAKQQYNNNNDMFTMIKKNIVITY